ncbi:BMC domain-containing protein [Desulfosoma sp.]
MGKRSVGLIETRGFTPALEAADVGAKAASVVIPGFDVVPEGRVVVRFLGDVAAVTAAVRAGTAAAERVGQVISSHVIPRLDQRLDPWLQPTPFSSYWPVVGPPPPPRPRARKAGVPKESEHEAQAPQPSSAKEEMTETSTATSELEKETQDPGVRKTPRKRSTASRSGKERGTKGSN